MEDRVILWRLTWSHGFGVQWLAMRACDSASAECWIDVYKKDDAQGVVYIASKKQPKMPENARDLARHATTF